MHACVCVRARTCVCVCVCVCVCACVHRRGWDEEAVGMFTKTILIFEGIEITNFIAKIPVDQGRYHGGQRLSSDDSLHSPTVISPLAFDKPSIMMRYHRRQTCSHTSPHCLPMMVTLHDTGFVECQWWNDGWTVKTVVTGHW